MEQATRAIVDLSAIRHNVALVKQRIGQRLLMAVVKADGYGHGAVEVSRAALNAGADTLAVGIPEEGQRLRQEGIQAPILVFNLIQPAEADKVARSDLTQTVDSIELCRALDGAGRRFGKKIKIHIKVDTGMGRLGFLPSEALPFVRRALEFPNLTVEGIFSHFSSADEGDKSYSLSQLNAFLKTLGELSRAGIEIPIKHMANSAAVLDLPESYLDMVRPGLILYGLYPSPQVSRDLPLQPAMTLFTKISALKTLPAGAAISYGRSFITSKPSRVAVLNIGYADGYSRVLSNRTEFLVRGRRVPQIGNICMDMCMVDVGEVEGCSIGDDVIVFGPGLPVEEVAARVGTLNYEIICLLNHSVPRIYVGTSPDQP